MQLDLSLIDKYFPLEAFREGQREAVERVLRAFDSGKKFVILEGPTGSGKSVIAYVIANYFKYNFYITAQKTLQDQLMRDFETPVRPDLIAAIDLKGRNAYRCTLADKYHSLVGAHKYKRALDCGEGICKREYKKSKCFDCFPEGFDNPQLSTCPYWLRVWEAMQSRMTIMNFSSFLYQTAFTSNFQKRDLLIVDECLHPHTSIVTDRGRIAIGKLVNQRVAKNVLSYNERVKCLEYKPIKRYLKRPAQQTYRVIAGNRIFYATADHKIMTPNGLRRLHNLNVGDLVLTAEFDLSWPQKQLLLGSLLGDAALHIIKPKDRRRRPLCRIRFLHGPKQFAYIDWKYEIISEHVRTRPKITINRGYGNQLKCFATKCNLFSAIKSVLRNDVKSPNRDWLDQVDDLGLAIWYMDDGSIASGIARFHTEGFTRHQNLIICAWLHDKHNLSAKLLSYHKNGHKLYYISMGRSNTKKLAAKIARFIPSFMRYKLPKGTWPAYDNSIMSIRPECVSYQPILSITKYKKTVTYDLEVADNHNYIAGTTIVSNCHAAEGQLMNFVSLELSDKLLLKHGIKFPIFEDVHEYVNYFNEIKLEDLITMEIETSNNIGDIKGAEEWKQRLQKLKKLKFQDPDEWVVEAKEEHAIRKVEFKPLFVRDEANSLLFSYADHVLLMSATVLHPDIIYDALGIDRAQATSMRMKCRFPVKNRPIILSPVGSMSYKKKSKTIPKLLKAINKICKKHKQQRGIIHTHNFALSHAIIKGVPALADRYLFQKDWPTKTIMLEEHANRSDSVLVAPALHEGLDLKDDLSRFAIIAKVPYPSIGADNKQLRRRMELSNEYYQWLTALKLVQSYGRSVRSENDWAVTYILDSDFEMFLSRSGHILPSWFIESIRIENI